MSDGVCGKIIVTARYPAWNLQFRSRTFFTEFRSCPIVYGIWLDTPYVHCVADDRSRCRRLGEHAKLIHRGVSALSCGTQPPRGLHGCRRLSNFLHRRPDVQFIASHGIYCIAPIFARRKTRGRSREGSTFLQLQNLSMRAIRHAYLTQAYE